MRDLSQSCIFDDNSENLNTTMNISLDDEKYKVAVCDNCEDLASPKAIKELIPIKLKKLDEKSQQLELLKLAAAELGFDLVKSGSSELMIPTPKIKEPPQPPQSITINSPATLEDAPIVKMGDTELKVQKNLRQNITQDMTPEEADAALEAAKRHSERVSHLESATSGEAAPYTPHDTKKPIKINTQFGEKVYKNPIVSKEIQTVRGRAGVPTTITKSLQSADGKTTIKIVNTGGDKALQERARQLGALREHGDASYYSTNCRPCQGRGFHGNENKPCRTCNGTGIII
jgi:hypothetical protein